MTKTVCDHCAANSALRNRITLLQGWAYRIETNHEGHERDKKDAARILEGIDDIWERLTVLLNVPSHAEIRELVATTKIDRDAHLGATEH